MDTVTAVATSALVILIGAALYVGVFIHSYNRGCAFGRPIIVAVPIAVMAAAMWPVTLLYWIIAPTPKGMARQRRMRSG